jgi:hypothetical protein
MAHKCGFTYKVLDGVFNEAGFVRRAGLRRPQVFDLWIVAFKNPRDDLAIKETAFSFIP